MQARPRSGELPSGLSNCWRHSRHLNHAIKQLPSCTSPHQHRLPLEDDAEDTNGNSVKHHLEELIQQLAKEPEVAATRRAARPTLMSSSVLVKGTRRAAVKTAAIAALSAAMGVLLPPSVHDLLSDQSNDLLLVRLSVSSQDTELQAQAGRTALVEVQQLEAYESSRLR